MVSVDAAQPWLGDLAAIVQNSRSLPDAKAGLLAWDGKAGAAGFEDTVFQSAAMSYLAGQLFVRDIELGTNKRELLDVAVGQEGQFLAMPFEEATALFRARRIVPPEEFYASLGEMRQRAFTASRLATDHLREVAYTKLQQALEGGGDFNSFAAAIRAGEAELGIEPVTHAYLRTVFNTNVATAYGAGRFRQLTDPTVIEALPYRMYVAIDDARTRPEHLELNGKIWEAADTEWHDFQPPNGFNCRCVIVSLEPDDDRLQSSSLSREASHPDDDFRGPPTVLIEE